MFAKLLSKEQSTILSFSIRAFDLLFYVGSGILAFYMQFHTLHFPLRYQIALLWATLLVTPVFYTFGIYYSLRGKSFADYVQLLIVATVTLMLLLGASAFVTKTGEYYSRSWFLSWHLYAVISLLFARICLYKILGIMRRHGINHKRIAIIGSGKLAHDLIKNTKHALWTGFDVVAIFDNHPISAKICGVQVQHPPEDLSKYVEKNNIVEIWLALSLWTPPETENLISKLNLTSASLRYFPDITNLNLLNHSVTEILGFPVINITASPIAGINRLIKAVEDRLLAFIILALLSPIMLITAVLVKLSSPGPIFYRQSRVSWNNNKFEMLKFRSMPVNAEINTGAVWATAEDKRATKIGSFLRRTSIDELPQLLNVLKGDMSIVGPRPERPEFVNKFKHEIPQYMQKHLVKAGITGWAQIHGWRGNTSLHKRIEHDIYYISHWSLWFDIKIICLTVFKGFINKNAY